MSLPYHGEGTCVRCDRPAYYGQDNEPRCGYHSKKGERRNLRKNPATEAAKLAANEARYAYAAEMAAKNRAAGLPGSVTLRRFHQREAFEPTPGSLIVWPNHSRPKVKVDLWVPELSPKSMGPVASDHPNEPEALTIESLMQAARVFEFELDSEGNPLPSFYERRNEAYQDPFRATWRHPFGPTKAAHQAALKKLGQPEDAPIAYTVHSAPDGSELHLSYIESRVYYCRAFERIALQSEVFWNLQALKIEGWNLELCGWDARTWAPTDEELAEAYVDPRFPFGHETVVYSLLQGSSPWRG